MRHVHRTTLPNLDAVEAQMVAMLYRLVEEFPTEGQFTVALWQNNCRDFAVTYGMQLTKELTYLDACNELGECLLHQLTCAGKVRALR